WSQVPLYLTQVAEINATTGRSLKWPTQFGLFDYDGTVHVSVEPDPTVFPTISSVRIRPLSYGIEPKVSDGKIRFSLSQPQRNVVVEVNGDVFNVVTLWTNEIEKDAISEQEASDDSSIVYFGPGYHDLKDPVDLKSGQTLYLASGAYLHAPAPTGISVQINNAEDVAVRGRGFMSAAMSIQNSTNVAVVGGFASTGGFLIAQSNNVHVSGWKSMTSHQWGDGMDLYCSQDVVVEQVFLRTSDDCFAIYQHRGYFYGDSSNITLRDSSLWADVAHPINIGTHGNPENPETMDGVTIQNLDILDHREPQVDYEGCIAFTVGDENLVTNVLVDDVRVEDFRWGMLLSLRVVFNKKYNTGAGRGLKNVVIKDLVYTSSGDHIVNTAVILGYSEDRSVDNVDFQGLTINGLHVWDKMTKPSWFQTSDSVPMILGSFANNVTF
ncbi:pectin lyase fold/virulence factor, partial [Dactylonectria macrodidyma]